MSLINSVLKLFQWPVLRRLGKILFLSGAGLLSFSGTCVIGFRDFCLELPNVMLSILVTSFILILAGESMLTLARNFAPEPVQRSLFHHWLGKSTNVPERDTIRSCSFCGNRIVHSRALENKREPSDADKDSPPLLLGVCLGCGKTVCPRCAYMKGMEMKVNSFLCPGCGNFVL